MACKGLDTCDFLNELSSSAPIACGMVMATNCDNINFSCKGYRSSKEIGVDNVPDYQWPNNKLGVMEFIMDRRRGISITG